MRYGRYAEAGVLKKLILAGLAELSRVKLTKVWFASVGYRGLGVHDRPPYTANSHADSTEQYEIPGVSPLSLAERG